MLPVGSATHPVASFAFSPTNPKVVETVNFNAAESAVPPGRQIMTSRATIVLGGGASLAKRVVCYGHRCCRSPKGSGRSDYAPEICGEISDHARVGPDGSNLDLRRVV